MTKQKWEYVTHCQLCRGCGEEPETDDCPCHESTPPRPPEGKHSPLPWIWREDWNHTVEIWIDDEKTKIVTDPLSCEDAELIVRAVNLHAKLVAGLQDVTDNLSFINERLENPNESLVEKCERSAERAYALLREAAK